MLRYNQIAGQKVSRVEALSDGVFSIAMTLLVLDLRIPEAVKALDGAAQLLNVLPRFGTYALSFMTLGIFWMGHTTQFTYIHRADRHLSWLSIVFLAFVSLIPFSTAFLSESVGDRWAIAVYWLNLVALGNMLYIHWSYARRKGLMNDEYDIATISKAVAGRIYRAQAIYATGALVGMWQPYIGLAIIFSIQIVYVLGLDTKKTGT